MDKKRIRFNTGELRCSIYGMPIYSMGIWKNGYKSTNFDSNLINQGLENREKYELPYDWQNGVKVEMEGLEQNGFVLWECQNAVEQADGFKE